MTTSAQDIMRVEVFGFQVFSDDLAKIPLRHPCATVSTISPNSYGISTRDPEFRRALRDADYLMLDGVYFALGSILLHGRGIRPNQGPDLFTFFMHSLNERHGRAFFLGSTPATLEKIRTRAAVDYPAVTVGSHSPPFKAHFEDQDNHVMVEKINAFGPDVVFVGMTAPKQEKWAHRHRERLSAKLVICIGAVFDWYAGNEKPVEPIWWRLRLGWLIRTIRRPEILRRYPSILIFFWHLALALARVRRFGYEE
jgi:N-acetylglucosaminyldiphosphoundecaprenol N-acetyl-beta-D-mannosaminyltransferase